jgi:tripartite-type tricarboxylate transporter receptor subunit TctC
MTASLTEAQASLTPASAGRRQLIRSLPVLGLMGIATPWALAQGAYPNRPLRVIVPQPPGGGFDFVARALADRLSKQIGQSVVVENKTGSGTLIGTEAAAKADPDGYTESARV